MAIIYDSYEQVWIKLLQYVWGADTVVYFQPLDSGYVYDKTHVDISSIAGYEVGDPILLTGKTITQTGITCADVTFSHSGTISPVYGVIYIFGAAESISDSLLFHMNLNNSSALDLTNRSKLGLGELLSWSQV